MKPVYIVYRSAWPDVEPGWTPQREFQAWLNDNSTDYDIVSINSAIDSQNNEVFMAVMKIRETAELTPSAFSAAFREGKRVEREFVLGLIEKEIIRWSPSDYAAEETVIGALNELKSQIGVGE